MLSIVVLVRTFFCNHRCFYCAAVACYLIVLTLAVFGVLLVVLLCLLVKLFRFDAVCGAVADAVADAVAYAVAWIVT